MTSPEGVIPSMLYGEDARTPVASKPMTSREGDVYKSFLILFFY